MAGKTRYLVAMNEQWHRLLASEAGKVGLPIGSFIEALIDYYTSHLKWIREEIGYLPRSQEPALAGYLLEHGGSHLLHTAFIKELREYLNGGGENE